MKRLAGVRCRAGLLASLVAGLVVPTVRASADTPADPGTVVAAASGDRSGSRPGDVYRLLNLFGIVLEEVRADYVRPVSATELVDNALEGMLSGLDPHSAYLTPQEFDDRETQIAGKFAGIGLQLEQDRRFIKVVAPLDGTPAKRAGIKPGDLVLGIDGTSVDGMSLDDAIGRIKGDPGTVVTLTVKPAGDRPPRKVRLVREIVHVTLVTSARYGRIAYIRLAEFDTDAAADVRSAWNTLSADGKGRIDGLVLDLRGDPGGLLDQAVGICDEFIGSGAIVSTRGRHPSDDRSWNADGSDMTGGIPMVLLINGGTASASEIVSGALQDHRRALVLGTRSFGKGSVQTLMPIGSDGGIVLTTALYYTPSGRSIQAEGIVPDIAVKEERDDEDIVPDREADLLHSLRNAGGTPAASVARQPLPPIAALIPHEPPPGWPAFDPADPKTDFQLQQALVVLRAGQPELHAAR